jgi:hypothetical protein
MTEFDTSLDIGKQREDQLIAFFQSLGHKPIAIPGKFTGFDFFLANTKEAYEVKQDWKAHYYWQLSGGNRDVWEAIWTHGNNRRLVDLRYKNGVYIYLSKEAKRLDCIVESTPANLHRKG